MGQSWAARKDPEDILPVTSHAGLVESSPLIGFLLKEAIVNLGMLLLTARAYFCHCRGICSPEEAAGKGRPDKLASPAFKQVVWRLLASVGRSRSWHSLTQKYVLSASSLERCEAELYVQFQSKCFIFNVNVKTMTPAPIWKWFVVITLTLTGFVSSGADRDFVSGPKVHRCVFPLDGNRAVGQLLFFL